RHGEKGMPLVISDLQDLRDVRVVQRRRGPGLAPEALPVPAAHLARGEDLERHLAAGPLVTGAIDHAHAAAAEQAEDAVMGDRAVHIPPAKMATSSSGEDLS